MKKRLLAGALGAMLVLGSGSARGDFSPSRTQITVNDRTWDVPVVTVVDQFGGGTNYVKLRDLANILNGTGGSFSVGFDGSTRLTPGGSYSPLGTELTDLAGKEMELVHSVVTVDGESRTLEAVWVKDGGQNGYLCYKLRELGEALGLNIGWNAQQGVVISTPAAAVTTVSEATEGEMSQYEQELQKILEQDKLIYGE